MAIDSHHITRHIEPFPFSVEIPSASNDIGFPLADCWLSQTFTHTLLGAQYRVPRRTALRPVFIRSALHHALFSKLGQYPMYIQFWSDGGSERLGLSGSSRRTGFSHLCPRRPHRPSLCG